MEDVEICPLYLCGLQARSPRKSNISRGRSWKEWYRSKPQIPVWDDTYASRAETKSSVHWAFSSRWHRIHRKNGLCQMAGSANFSKWTSFGPL